MLRRQRRDLVCQQLVELVTDYLEGDLDPQQRQAVEAHLGLCGDCAGYVAQVRRMLELTREDTPDRLPDEMVDRLTSAFRSRR